MLLPKCPRHLQVHPLPPILQDTAGPAPAGLVSMLLPLLPQQ